MLPAMEMILENRQLLMILTTSAVVLVGCFFVFVWRRSSSGRKFGKELEPPKIVVPKRQIEQEVDDGKKKVTIFFGTQTGTDEGFAKENYAADDDEYAEKLKKENFAFFFLATYGDGEPTDNAARFYKWFAEGDEKGVWVEKLQYGVFGLGNKQYEHFNKIAKVVDEGLTEQACVTVEQVKRS